MELLKSDLYNTTYVKAYYRFEAGALTTDTTGGHALTDLNSCSEDTGKYGGGVVMGTSDAYSATNHADFRPTGAFSVVGWVKSSNAAEGYIFQSYSQNTNRAGIFARIDGTTGVITCRSGRNTGASAGTDYQVVTGGTVVTGGAWHHFAYTWDTANLRLYVDGKSDANAVAWTYAPGYAATNYVRVGCLNITGTDTAFLLGCLDDIALYNGKALGADEVWSLYEEAQGGFLLNFI